MNPAGILPPTSRRVEEHTNKLINARIQQTADRNVVRYLGKSDTEITARINDLDKEWDIERVIETSDATIIVTSALLGYFADKRWLILTGIIGSFLLQHALQGWCPSMPFLRMLGFRTQREINQEKTALKQLRGDFMPTHDPYVAIDQARK